MSRKNSPRFFFGGPPRNFSTRTLHLRPVSYTVVMDGEPVESSWKQWQRTYDAFERSVLHRRFHQIGETDMEYYVTWCRGSDLTTTKREFVEMTYVVSTKDYSRLPFIRKWKGTILDFCIKFVPVVEDDV